MTEQTEQFNTIAPLRNVSRLTSLIKQLDSRGEGLPGMGVFYGPSGFGKSMSTVYASNVEQAVTVQVKSTWTTKKLCQAIALEMGLKPAKTSGDMVEQISQELLLHDVPLLVDEADFLVQRNMIEVVRDIYESAFVPVVLIGEEQLPQKLKKWERVHGRILSWVTAEPADDQDYELLKRIYCPGVELDAEMTHQIKQAARGSARRICTNLDRIREVCLVGAKDRMTFQEWGDRGFYTGDAPMPRRTFR